MAVILVVDDSAVDRKIAGACVRATGSKARYAASGREAIEIIVRDRPDVVLTDLMMPEMDGLQLVEHIRREHTALPVVLMTAFGSEETAIAALKAGATSYVPKKSLKDELGSALRIVLSAVEARKHREKVRGLLERSESHFIIGYEPDAPAALVSYLENDLAQLNFCDRSGLFQVNAALSEALANAIEHGNLELDSALRERHDGSYQRLGEERVQQAPYRTRKVHVEARVAPDHATYVVRDEGPGFDASLLPNPKDPENMVKACGRGIMLIRMFMDDVTFNQTGNEITMVKRRTP
jgi:CheY-like chemotaxis protein/anti-sigma regulatory factor (Ser/Thr protein kinase)